MGIQIPLPSLEVQQMVANLHQQVEALQRRLAAERPDPQTLPASHQRFKQGYVEPDLEEFLQVLAELGDLSNNKQADFFGVTRKSIENWKNGTNRIPYTAWRSLLLELGRV